MTGGRPVPMALLHYDDARLARAGDRELAFDPDPDAAARTLLAMVPRDAQQGEARVRMLAFLRDHEHPLSRACRAGHLTGSALVVDYARERGLLTLHRKLGRWLQLGGHLDGDANLAAGALREAVEESGIDDLRIDPRPVDLDIHPIPARGDEPEHLHLDVRFLAYAPQGARPAASDESDELRWFTPGELDQIVTDESARRLFRIAFGNGSGPAG